jgi:tetratricopeptide (TPR) repeat protein
MILYFLLVFPLFVLADDVKQAKKLLAEGHYKGAIKELTSLTLKADEKDRGEYLRLLAESYYKDQEHEKAFKTYLESLNALSSKNTYTATEEENQLYREALKIYLDERERDPKMISLKIRDLYAGIWRLHPNYANLGYLVAIAYANLGDYPDFFEIFFQSYLHVPEHFLSYKSQGLLHLKLYERARTPEEKEEERKAVLLNFKKAKELFPMDPTLYKMEIAFSIDKENVIERNLKEIIDKDIVIPRSDLSFYFDQLFSFGKNVLASEFLLKARKWYPYSRTLDAANEVLQAKTDENRGSDGARSTR